LFVGWRGRGTARPTHRGLVCWRHKSQASSTL